MTKLRKRDCPRCGRNIKMHKSGILYKHNCDGKLVSKCSQCADPNTDCAYCIHGVNRKN